uniref:Uncharacterized protein AlNc14C2G238 n=1 Tax=Albugo laibachii Nc14 TaxID=890382 RepID=F0VZ97_9STRA|nr:conserved hypothetical protein [Albugo laibachii Nc14]|eukprot:CCA14127.1 conserved hypothetical protein [Albugo laibachii Nc14]
MEAASWYPIDPPQLVDYGLGSSFLLSDPDTIPSHATALNDPLHKTALKLYNYNVPYICVRNLQSYPYLRKHERAKILQNSRPGYRIRHLKSQKRYYQRRHRHFIAESDVIDLIQDEFDSDPPVISSYQGNTLAGISDSQTDEHIVLFPSGEIIQKVSVAMYSSYSEAFDDPRPISGIETGSMIRQISVLGSSQRDNLSSESFKAFIAVRGEAQCTILSISKESSLLQLRMEEKLSFDRMLSHVASSPHSDRELAIILDGSIQIWTPNGTKRIFSGKESIHLSEYSSHPCVLWSATKESIHTVDLRESNGTNRSRKYDLKATPSDSILALQRLESCPSQLILKSSHAMEIVDSRMPRASLLAWACPSAQVSNLANFKFHTNDTNAIFASSVDAKSTSVYTFAYGRPQDPCLELIPSRQTSKQRVSQCYATDAPLELRLLDGSESTTVLGMCAFPRQLSSKSVAILYQQNTLGDLHAQELCALYAEDCIKTIHKGLPCGTTIVTDPARTQPQRLPISADAIYPEYDAISLKRFRALPIKKLLGRFPSVCPSELSETEKENLTIFLTKNAKLVDPSVLFHRLHRYVNEQPSFTTSSHDLMEILLEHKDFCLRRIRPRRIRSPITKVMTPLNDVESPLDCSCRLEMESTIPKPCASISCIVPHSVMVYRDNPSLLSLSNVMPPLRFGCNKRSQNAKYLKIIQQVKATYRVGS